MRRASLWQRKNLATQYRGKLVKDRTGFWTIENGRVEQVFPLHLDSFR
jgi:hypothetical protein